MSPFLPLPITHVLRNILVGCGCASYWRGAWYVLDDNLYPDNAKKSAAASLALGTTGMIGSQGILLSTWRKPAIVRYAALYSVAFSCVLVWRGAWVGWDVFYEEYLHPHIKDEEDDDVNHGTHSGLISHIAACGALAMAGTFASVLAPPSAVSVIRDAFVRTATVQNAAGHAFQKQVRRTNQRSPLMMSSVRGLNTRTWPRR